MERFADYILHEKLHDSIDSAVYRGTRETSAERAIVKVLKTKYPTVSDIARFRQEYSLVKRLDIDGVVKTHALLEDGGNFAIVQEDFDGIPLKQAMKKGKKGLAGFLRIAREIAHILGQIHQNNIIHLDIKPGNILVNEKTGQVKITDFGISASLTHVNDELYHPEVIEGTLLYMSPEQTGRMNRNVDYRTDLYSLGITFYEMLTGRVPFRSSDPMEVIHSHIARAPKPPERIEASIPQVLSNIVMKLLSKTPEERYQNSLGLMADLDECLKQLTETGEIGDFELAARDISIRFNLPQIIVGREKHFDAMMAAFEKASIGGKGITFVLGSPGIGKSALVREIHKPIVGKRGYFISGKYDQFKREVPYSSIIQAFQGLTRQILTESEERIAAWKKNLTGALGPNGKVVSGVIPELELIIGAQSQVPELPPEESQNRFNIVFQNFISVFTTKEHPLVIFLDDLQWADPASLTLLKTIMTHPDTRYLLLIGAYRDTEVTPHHPLSITMNEIRRIGSMEGGDLAINTITLNPLDEENVNRMIMNVLRCKASASFSLSEVVHRKTGGNPFFVNQFLKNLYDNKYIELGQEGSWVWDLERIGQMQVTDNVVSFMAGKISKLPERIKNILRIGACIGNRFDLETLSMVAGKSIDETLFDLMGAVHEDMVAQFGDLYKFLHDRIHEAAYSLISADEKAAIHYRIGTNLLKETPSAAIDDKIFYIVDQLNRGGTLVTGSDEKIRLAELNLKAGEKAKNSTAYASALAYLKEGIALLPPDRWESRYNLTYRLSMGQMTCEYLTQNFEGAVLLFNDIIKNSANNIHKAEAYTLMVILFTNRGNYEEALRLGLEGCRLIGFITPRKVSNGRIAFELLRLYFKMGKRKIEDLADLPIAEDEEFLAYHNMQIQTGTVGYYMDPNLFCFIVIYGLSKIFEYGNSYISPLAYCALGSIIGPGVGLYEAAYRFGQTAMKIDKNLAGTGSSSRTKFIYTMFIQHWKKHARFDVDLYRESYKRGIEMGDLIYSSHSINMLGVTRIMIGDNLDDILDEYGKYRNFQLGNKDPFMARRFMENIHLCKCLKGQTRERGSLDSDEFSEADQIGFYYREKNYLGIYYFDLTKMRMCYLFGKYKECTPLIQELETLTRNKIGTGSLYVPEANFYSSLSLSALYLSDDRERKKVYLDTIKRNQKKMRTWKKHCPENFLHKYLIVEAELARCAGDAKKAISLYKEAIQSARENGYVQNEGIACERAALLAREMKEMGAAVAWMKQAYFCFVKYGASEKVKDLEERYPDLFPDKSGKSDHQGNGGEVSTTAYPSTGAGTKSLDLSTVIKTSQSLSSEVDLGVLLEKIIHLSIENAGAHVGYLILESEFDKKLYIEAAGRVDEETAVLKAVPLEETQSLAVSIVHYVHKTGENIVLGDASADSRFVTDPYIIKNRPKSLICAPIVYKGKTAGIVYLENNLTTNAFTPERLELLGIFSAQAAISIENSRLIAHREKAATLATEMNIAANIQSALLPDEPRIPGFDVTAYLKPADAVGGDYYDLINTSSYHWVIIGDVSGHGVPAGLIMMMVQTTIQALVRAFPELKPSRLLHIVNQAIKYNIDKMKEQKYMTITAFRFDTEGNALFSGMHQDILVYRASESIIDTIPSKGIWLSPWDMNAGDTDCDLNLQKGDVMLLYTDGVTEAKSPSEAFFSQERLADILKTSAVQGTEGLKEAILNALSGYRVDDDIAMVILERR